MAVVAVAVEAVVMVEPSVVLDLAAAEDELYGPRWPLVLFVLWLLWRESSSAALAFGVDATRLRNCLNTSVFINTAANEDKGHGVVDGGIGRQPE